MNTNYKPPEYLSSAFNCPICGAYAKQQWNPLFTPAGEQLPITRVTKEHEFSSKAVFSRGKPSEEQIAKMRFANSLVTTRDRGQISTIDRMTLRSSEVFGLSSAHCAHCEYHSIWLHGTLIHPANAHADLKPNESLPEELQKDFIEAAAILDLSPRGACALGRLIVEKLCIHLGAKDSENLFGKIGSLVELGLPDGAQEALDYARIIGGDQVHPGKIVDDDDADIARQILLLINIFAEKMLTAPATAKALYAGLPSTKKAAVERRDKRTPD